MSRPRSQASLKAPSGGRQFAMLGSSTAPERVGKVRVAVVGDTGSGKTSWVHLIRANGPHGGSRGAGAASVRDQERTMGCKPEVTMVSFDEVRTTGGANPSRPYFVEMWDVGGHHEWKNLRAAFYADLDGVVLVHDLTRRRTLGRLARWAREIAASASFASQTPAGSETDARDAMVAAVGGKLLGDALDGCVVHGFCGLPVPALFVGNKADIVDPSSSRDGEDASTPGEILSALLWRAWVAIATRLRLPKAWRGGANGTPGGHKRSGSFATLLPTTVQELKRVSSGVFGDGGGVGGSWDQPDTPPSSASAAHAASLPPPSGGLRCSATRGDVDMTVVEAYFRELIRRRHYTGKAGGTVWASVAGGGTSGGFDLPTPPTTTRGDHGGGAWLRGTGAGTTTQPARAQWMGGDRLDANDLT